MPTGMRSITTMLQKLHWDSLRQLLAQSRVQMLYRIRNDLVAIPISAHLQPAAILTRDLKPNPVQNQHIQSYLLSKCSLPMERTSCSCWCLPAAAGKLQGSTVQHRTDVDACWRCFYPLHCTVFIRFVCSAVWHQCFRVVHLDPSPWCDTARPLSWHLPGRRRQHFIFNRSRFSEYEKFISRHPEKKTDSLTSLILCQ